MLPLARQLGFDGLYIAQAEINDLAALRQAADGQLVFMGGIPVSLLVSDAKAQDLSATIARVLNGGRTVVSVSGEIDDSVLTSSFFSLVAALSAVKPV